MIFQLLLTSLLISFKVVAEEELKEGNSCITPNKENATCIPLKKCKVIMFELGKFTPEAFQFAKISECGSGRGLVCCGSFGYVTTKMFSTKPIVTTTTLATEDDIILSDFSDISICGVHANPPNRVKGGHVADLEDFPWVVALEYESNYDQKNVGIKCGGSLISHTFILTAAHCTIHHEFIVVRAWLGVSNLTSAENCLNITNNIRCANSIHIVNIEETIPNYDYERLGQINDIGLLQIKYVWFTDYIRPICLPSSNSPSPKLGTTLTAAGWGYTDSNKPSETKLTVDLPLQNNSICGEALKIHGNVIDSKQLCVGGEKGKDSCQGDSGGPLMRAFIVKNKESRWLQEGIVSYGVGCGIHGLPAVYVNVSAYIDWIINKTNEIETNYKDLKEGDSCITPNEERAKCVQLEDCEVIIDVLNNFTVEAFNFFTNSQCGSSRAVVCCGSMGYKKIVIETTKLARIAPSEDENKVILSDYSDESLCGLDWSTNRIIGGSEAGVYEFPWLTALEYKSKLDNTNGGILCAGSVISNTYILTAAHCIDHEGFMVVNVWLGASQIISNKNCIHFDGEVHCHDQSIEKVAVEKTFSHPRYNKHTKSNDIGLLRVKHIKYNSYIRPICLPSHKTPPPQSGTYMTIAGWGLTENGTFSDIKLKLEVPTQNNVNCSKFLEGSNVTLNSKQLCAGGERGREACLGDSGAPLMKTFTGSNGDIIWIQEGLISYGTGCGVIERPSIYTRIPSYEIWITKTIRDVETDLGIGDNCTTPDGTIGTCVPLQICRAVFDAISTANLISQEFANKSYCGYKNETLVCCETPGSVITADLKSKAIPAESLCGVVEEQARNNDEEVAKVGEFPWMANIQYIFQKTGKDAGIKCAGSLINNHFVLTAAHCLLKKNFEPIKVWLGELDTSEDPSCAEVECTNTLQKVPIQKSIPYVFYNVKTGHNDIGLIKMEHPVQFNKYISPICLPFASSPLPDSETHIIVIARGITENDKYSNILKTAKLSLISSEACGEMFNKKEYLCVNIDPDTNDCEGNKGAALIRISEDRRYQEGVVSDKIDCQSGKSVSFHTRVANYLYWIVNVISEDQLSN